MKNLKIKSILIITIFLVGLITNLGTNVKGWPQYPNINWCILTIKPHNSYLRQFVSTSNSTQYRFIEVFSTNKADFQIINKNGYDSFIQSNQTYLDPKNILYQSTKGNFSVGCKRPIPDPLWLLINNTSGSDITVTVCKCDTNNTYNTYSIPDNKEIFPIKGAGFNAKLNPIDTNNSYTFYKFSKESYETWVFFITSSANASSSANVYVAFVDKSGYQELKNSNGTSVSSEDIYTNLTGSTITAYLNIESSDNLYLFIKNPQSDGIDVKIVNFSHFDCFFDWSSHWGHLTITGIIFGIVSVLFVIGYFTLRNRKKKHIELRKFN